MVQRNQFVLYYLACSIRGDLLFTTFVNIDKVKCYIVATSTCKQICVVTSIPRLAITNVVCGRMRIGTWILQSESKFEEQISSVIDDKHEIHTFMSPAKESVVLQAVTCVSSWLGRIKMGGYWSSSGESLLACDWCRCWKFPSMAIIKSGSTGETFSSPSAGPKHRVHCSAKIS